MTEVQSGLVDESEGLGGEPLGARWKNFNRLLRRLMGLGCVRAVGWGWGSVSGDEAWAGCEEFGGSAMRRRGRKRQAGHRTRSGRLVHDPRLSSAAIAATMPHRHALGEKAVDQLAESELGRLTLRGELEPVLAAAGADYARHWRGYIAPLCSQSPCSAPALTAAERWARCGS